MKNITRTIESHVIQAAKVRMVEGEVRLFVLDDITATNVKLNEEKALKLVRKEYGRSDNYVITAIKTEKITYSVPIEDFMKMAVRTNDSETETIQPIIVE